MLKFHVLTIERETFRKFNFTDIYLIHMMTDQFVTTQFVGFPVGFQDGSTYYIYNHVNIILEYHTVEEDGHRLVVHCFGCSFFLFCPKNKFHQKFKKMCNTSTELWDFTWNHSL